MVDESGPKPGEAVMADVFIGCSGFNYRHWRGTFYPEKLPQKRWFEHYWNVFPTVELKDRKSVV